MITKYRENEKELKQLFKEVFNEEDGFTNVIFGKKLSKSDIFTIKKDGKIVAFAYGILFDYKTDNAFEKCVYIYGVGVRKECRGQGLARKIMNEIDGFYKDKGISFLYLVPATNELFSMYEKMGYDTFVKINYKNYDLKDIKNVLYEIKDGNFNEDYEKYTGNKNNVIIRKNDDNEALLSYLKYKKINESGFLYYTKDESATVRESFVYSEKDLLGFLNYLKDNGIKTATVVNEKDNTKDYALIKKYREINLKNIYTPINFD